MWIITDEALDKMLGGCYTQVIEIKKCSKDTSIRKLFEFQFDYKSYSGFRKFFVNQLLPIVDKISYLDDSSLIGRFLKHMVGIK